MASIYLITNKITNKQYIGATVTSVKSRWNRHKSDALNHRGNQAIHQAIRKYGAESFEIQILYEHENETFIFEVMEPAFINLYKTYGNDGYNMTLGGDGWLGMKHTQEAKDKISNRNKGRIVSEETRKKLSLAAKGKPAWNKGLKCPELGDSKRGIRQTQSQKETTSNSIKEKHIHRTEEQKQKTADKISETHIIENTTTKEIITIENLRQFCKVNNLSQGNLITYGHTKNFKLLRTIKKARTYTIQNIDNQEIFTTNNLKQFCNSRGFSNGGLFNKYKSNKPYLNWKILNITITPQEKVY